MRSILYKCILICSLSGAINIATLASEFKITYPNPKDMYTWLLSPKIKGIARGEKGCKVEIYIKTDKAYHQGSATVRKDGSWVLPKSWPTPNTKNIVFAELYSKGKRIAKTPEVIIYPERQGNYKVTSRDGFVVICTKENEKSFLKSVFTSASKEAVDKLINEGVKYLAGSISEIAAGVAGHALSFFTAFIGAMPLANPPTEVEFAWICKEGVKKKHLEASVPLKVNVLVCISIGAEMLPDFKLRIIREGDSKEIWRKTLSVTQLEKVCCPAPKIIVIDRKPIKIVKPGTYYLMNNNYKLLRMKIR